jgi:sigma-B regulation protein RsbU (phosphoserine phosphatase)
VHNAPALPVGLFPDAQYEDSVISLDAGDRLYLHSDGLSEERDAAGEMFGMERVEETFRDQRGASLAASLDTIVAQIVSWHGSELLSDDIAVLALELQA